MIPIFRAKKLDSDEYIIGDLFDGKYIIAKSELNRDISEALKHIREDILTKDCISAECKNEHHLLNKMLNKLLVNERLEHIYEIDPTTLAIHFENMLDSQGNKIFASLQEDGKGGDIAKYNNKGDWIAIYIENAFMWVNVLDMQKIGTKQPVSFLRLKPLAKMIVIGIQE